MKKRMILLIVATVAVAILCAGLPSLTARLMDKTGENAPFFSNIHPVEQDTDQETGEQSMLEKLRLYGNGKSVDIKPANATKTELEVKKCVEAFLYPCQASGVYQTVTFPSPTLTAKLIYDVDDPSQSMIVWHYYGLKFRTTTDGQQLGEMQTMDVIVDDETGKILSVTFGHYNVSYSTKDIWERNKKRIEPLEKLYFAQLGLLEAAKAAKASPETYSVHEQQETYETEVHCTIEDSHCSVKLILAAGGKDAFRITVEKLKT